MGGKKDGKSARKTRVASKGEKKQARPELERPTSVVSPDRMVRFVHATELGRAFEEGPEIQEGGIPEHDKETLFTKIAPPGKPQKEVYSDMAAYWAAEASLAFNDLTPSEVEFLDLHAEEILLSLRQSGQMSYISYNLTQQMAADIVLECLKVKPLPNNDDDCCHADGCEGSDVDMRRVMVSSYLLNLYSQYLDNKGFEFRLASNLGVTFSNEARPSTNQLGNILGLMGIGGSSSEVGEFALQQIRDVFHKKDKSDYEKSVILVGVMEQIQAMNKGANSRG